MKRDRVLGFVAKVIVYLEQLAQHIQTQRFRQIAAQVHPAKPLAVDWVEVVIIREDNTVVARYKELRPKGAGAQINVHDYIPRGTTIVR